MEETRSVWCEKCCESCSHQLSLLTKTKYEDGCGGFFGSEFYVANCSKCNKAYILERAFSSDDMDMYEDEDGSLRGEFDYTDTIYCPSILATPCVPLSKDERKFVPTEILKLLRELEVLSRNNCEVTWGMCARAVVEATMAEKNVKGKKLIEKIENFKNSSSEEDRMTLGDFFEAVDRIRDRGNGAVHEFQTVTDDEKRHLAASLKSLLTVAFVIPGHMKEVALQSASACAGVAKRGAGKP